MRPWPLLIGVLLSHSASSEEPVRPPRAAPALHREVRSTSAGMYLGGWLIPEGRPSTTWGYLHRHSSVAVQLGGSRRESPCSPKDCRAVIATFNPDIGVMDFWSEEVTRLPAAKGVTEFRLPFWCHQVSIFVDGRDQAWFRATLRKDFSSKAMADTCATEQQAGMLGEFIGGLGPTPGS